MFKWIGAFGVNARAAVTVIAVIVATTVLAVAGQDFPKNGIVNNGARQDAPVDRYIDLKPNGVPTGASAEHVALVQRLEVAISEIDDTGLIFLWNGDTFKTIAECSWTDGGTHGYARREISADLRQGTNLIVFGIYNKVYEGGLLFGGGKWSGVLRLVRDNHDVWRTRLFGRENDEGLKFWKTLIANVSPQGRITVSEKITKHDEAILERFMMSVEKRLGETLDKEGRPGPYNFKFWNWSYKEGC